MATTCNEPNRHLQKGAHFASTANNPLRPIRSSLQAPWRSSTSSDQAFPESSRSIGDLRTAKSAIMFGVINGLFTPPVLELCLCTGVGRPCGGDAEQKYYQLANFVLAMLGVTLLFVDMALERAVFVWPLPRWPAMIRWMVWLTKVLTCGTLQFGVNLLYFCLRMLCSRFMLVSA